MKRNMVFKNFNSDDLLEQRIAFHEAGHATAICLNNKARNLPAVFFQIRLRDLNGKPEEYLKDDQATPNDCLARVEGGRLIELLPAPITAVASKATGQSQATAHSINNTGYRAACEADIINLLVGPLAEAKYIAEIDGELFNRKLVNLNALKNYGGSSDQALAIEYLQSLSTSKQQEAKLDALFSEAFCFINTVENWAAITKLADYIIGSNKNIISCEEVALLLES